MARIVQGGTTTPIEVVYLGSRFQVWKLPSYLTVFYQARSIDVSDPEATEMLQDMQQLEATIFEAKWVEEFDSFLGSL
jgi:hypothetical protein